MSEVPIFKPFAGDSRALNQEGELADPEREAVVGELDKKLPGDARNVDKREDELLLPDRVARTDTVLTPALDGEPGAPRALAGILAESREPAVFARLRSVFCSIEGGRPTVLLGDDVDIMDGAPLDPLESVEKRMAVLLLGSDRPNPSSPSVSMYISGVVGALELEYPDDEGGPARAAISAKKEKSKSSSAGGKPRSRRGGAVVEFCPVIVMAGE